MSSIYKKGRDGFYYYQAYVYNPETKKKDKRIYKALGTKDYIDAKKQQDQLDAKYLNNDVKMSNRSFILRKIKLNPIFLITIVIISILFGYSLFDESQIHIEANQLDSNYSIETSNESSAEKKDESTLSSIYTSNNLNTVHQIKDKSLIAPKSDDHLKQNFFPDFSIVNIDSNQRAFNQIKINLTINKDTGRKAQLMLCDSIAKQFRFFSNLIICLYSSDSTGFMMANNNDLKLNSEEKKKSWLAMYTYNEVEGIYFNDNPTGYLGMQK